MSGRYPIVSIIQQIYKLNFGVREVFMYIIHFLNYNERQL